jgi:transaldolase
MVKIPATKEGLPAIEQAISEGININVTLIFALQRYREVAEVYISGLEKRLKSGKPIDHVASVASVFVSRIDSLVDGMLDKKAAADASAKAKLEGLRGKAAVANTQMIYQAYKEIFGTPRFAALKAKGASVQRPLWGSTGTKNPAYSDLLYVETLVGPHTVNTVPPKTYSAILDHGKIAPSVESNLEAARGDLRNLDAAGIKMEDVTKKLEDDGVAAFEKSFDGLYNNLDEKRGEFVSVGV